MDITEQKQDEQRKNDFISMVSHELKTPLTSLSGYLQLLLLKAKKAKDAFQSDVVERADKQVKKMTRMALRAFAPFFGWFLNRWSILNFFKVRI